MEFLRHKDPEESPTVSITVNAYIHPLLEALTHSPNHCLHFLLSGAKIVLDYRRQDPYQCLSPIVSSLLHTIFFTSAEESKKVD